MIGQGLGEIIAEIPAHAKPVGRHAQQLALRAEVFKEHDQLQLEKDDRVNRGAAPGGIERAHKLADKGEIQRPVELTIEMIKSYQILGVAGAITSGGSSLALFFVQLMLEAQRAQQPRRNLPSTDPPTGRP